MTEERLIAGITVTDGGAPDGQELPKLIENAKENGIKAVSYTHLDVYKRQMENDILKQAALILGRK